MKTLIKDAAILFIITLAAGILLGFIYEITKEPRARQEELARQKAFKEVFGGADSFETYDYEVEKVSEYLKEKGITDKMVQVNEMAAAKDGQGNVLGYAITVTSKEGYSGDIKFTVGITNDGTVNAISILSISETAGLGMKAAGDDFKNQYANKKVENFVITKDGAKEENEIDVISGATITTNAMTNSVNAAIYCVDNITGGGDVE